MKKVITSSTYNKYHNYDAFDWAKLLSSKLKLTRADRDMLLHDLNNLRGNEWIDEVSCIRNAQLVEAFKAFVGQEDDI